MMAKDEARPLQTFFKVNLGEISGIDDGTPVPNVSTTIPPLPDTNLPDVPSPSTTDSLDSIIMDGYSHGISYFSKLLTDLSELTEDAKTARLYIQTYFKLYLQHNVTLKDISDFVGSDFSNLHKLYDIFTKLKKGGFANRTITLWLELVYDFYLSIVKLQVSKPVLDNLAILLTCNQFRLVFYERELDITLTAPEIETHTILGSLMIHQTSDETIKHTQKAIYSLVFKFSDTGGTFFTQWIGFVYGKNRTRAHVQSITGQANFTSDDCMIGLLRFTLSVWCDFFKQRLTLQEFAEDDHQGASLSVFIHRLIEISIIPVVTKLQYCQDNLHELDYMDSTSTAQYLQQFKLTLRKRITYYETLIKEMIPNVIQQIFFYYSWVSSHLSSITDNTSLTDNTNINSDDSTCEGEDDGEGLGMDEEVKQGSEDNVTTVTNSNRIGNPDEIIESIMNFTLLFTEYMSNDEVTEIEDLMYPIQKLSYQVLTDQIVVTNPHIKIKSFQCYYCFNVFNIISESLDQHKLLVNLLKLYQTCQKNDDTGTTSTKTQIISYLYENIEKIAESNVCQSLPSTLLEKSISSFIREVNYYIEESVQNITSLISDDTTVYTPETTKIYTSRVIYYANIHLRLANKIVSTGGQLTNFTRIIPSITNSIGYNTQYLTKICKLTENVPNSCSVVNNFRKLVLLLVDDSQIMTTLARNNDTFRLDDFKTICTFTNTDPNTVSVFCEKYMSLWKNATTSCNLPDRPDELCDPLLCIPITHPVVVPGSTNIMEKTVIERHLLEHEENPFNRAKLTIGELEEYQKTPTALNLLSEFNLKLDQWVESIASSEKDNTQLSDIDEGVVGDTNKENTDSNDNSSSDTNNTNDTNNINDTNNTNNITEPTESVITNDTNKGCP